MDLANHPLILQALVPVILALIAAGAFKSRRDRKRTDTETDATAADTWKAIAAERKADRDEIEAKFDKLEAEATVLRKEVNELRAEVEESRGLKLKYLAALTYIVYLIDALRRHVDPATIKPAPAEISADL